MKIKKNALNEKVCISGFYLCYLNTPVQQPLWAQLVLVVPDVLQHGALIAEWGDELEAVTWTKTQRPHDVDVVQAPHCDHVLWRSIKSHY